jgi:hypothetical protein
MRSIPSVLPQIQRLEETNKRLAEESKTNVAESIMLASMMEKNAKEIERLHKELCHEAAFYMANA